ncbi:MAG TPA: SCP2 sterol-binding domain-containing protein [Streptosporangiaceae bacterium]
MQPDQPRAVPASADKAGAFFHRLAAAGHVATFEGQPPVTLRFDLTDGAATDRWYVTVSNGDVEVTRRDRPADAVARTERRHFAAMAAGRMNAQAAMLRGLLACEGSMAALVMFQRCLPGPPGSTGRVAPITGATVTAQRRTA